jgi:glycosyltransferase involved in cell wall biosynthesis
MFLGLARNRKNNSNKITGFISISSHITQNLLNHGIERMRIFEIPNGVNIIRFKPLDHESKLALYKKMAMRNVFTFIYLGGLTFNKRIIEVVKAVALLKTKTVIDFQLFIVGPDREEGRIDAVIQKIINDSNLENIVFRVEHSENPERYIQVSDVFVLVSKKEGLSNALLEAMSCGLPVIGTEVSGSLDLIKRDINGVFSTGTSEDIAKCMHWYLRNTNVISEFGTASRKIIEDNYSHEAVLMQHIRLFSKYEKI